MMRKFVPAILLLLLSADIGATTICLSPGHPSEENDKLYEAVLNRKVAWYLKALLEQSEFQVVTTVPLHQDALFADNFDNEDPTTYPDFPIVTPEQRGRWCTQQNASFLISLHHNFSSHKRRNHTSVFYADTQDWKETHPGTKRWAKITARHLHRALETTHARTGGDRANLGFSLGVLAHAEMPGILVEASFYSHPEERRRLNTNAYLETEATAIFEAFTAYLEKHAPHGLPFASDAPPSNNAPPRSPLHKKKSVPPKE